MYSKNTKGWFPVLLIAALSLMIAIGFITTSAYADDTDSKLGPNSESNPYELKYEESVSLQGSLDDKRIGQKWFLYGEQGSHFFDFRNIIVANKNTSDSAKKLKIEHLCNTPGGTFQTEYYYFKLMPPVHYSIIFDPDDGGDIVTGMPESPLDAWQKEDSKIITTIPNAKPVRKGMVFGGWAKKSNDSPEVMPGETFAFDESEADENEIKLYAIWNYNATVRYRAEKNGKVSKSEEEDYIYDPSDLEGSTATGNNGYEFEGWYKDGKKIDGAEAALSPELIIANMNSHQEDDKTAYEDTTFTAKFKPAEYTITYDLDGGVHSVYGHREKYTIVDEDFTIYKPHKTGFEFLGWTGTGLDELTDFPRINKGSYGDREYKAHWRRYTEDFCIVEFADGLGNTLDAQLVEKGKAATAPADPERDGYIFDGWDTDFSKVTSDLTVTAKWKQDVRKHQVTFEDGQGNVLDKQTVVHGRPATAPEDPKREGFIFSGWDTDFSNVISDMTVKAMWTEVSPDANNYTVVFVLGFGLKPVSQVVAEGSTATEPQIPEVDGFTFIGWDKAGNNVRDNMTITARWKKDTVGNEHTVVFVDGYSYKPLVIQRVKDSTSAKPPADPKRKGYTFDGWDTDFSYVTENLTVIARWKEGEPTPTPESKPATAKATGTPLTKMTAKGNTALTIGWEKVKGADGYDVFFAKCNSKGKTHKCKSVKTIKGNKVFKWTKSGLKKGTPYKAYVKAYIMKAGKKTYISKSPVMHAYTGNGTKKYTNAKSVSLKNVKKGKLTLKKGKTFKIKAKVKKVKKNKKLFPKNHVPTLRYMTSNKKVATVSKSGKITAKGKGTCSIYVYAHNGVSKSIKITVP